MTKYYKIWTMECTNKNVLKMSAFVVDFKKRGTNVESNRLKIKPN